MLLPVIAAASDWVTATATSLGVLAAAAALWVAKSQLGGQRDTAKAQFLLSLDDAFRMHDLTHRKFRPAFGSSAGTAGIWHREGKGAPENAEEWADVEAYMGLFERVNAMLERRLIDADTVKRFYGYRVDNILTNRRVIDAKLLEKAGGWKDFLALAHHLGYWPPDALGRVKTTVELRQWPVGTEATVVDADSRCARIEIRDDQDA